MIKSLYYAYASSDTAKRLGFASTGCYYIHLESSEYGNYDVYASTDKSVSLNGAELHPEYKWGRWSLYQPTKF